MITAATRYREADVSPKEMREALVGRLRNYPNGLRNCVEGSNYLRGSEYLRLADDTAAAADEIERLQHDCAELLAQATDADVENRHLRELLRQVLANQAAPDELVADIQHAIGERP